jgi:outer membrane protein assembly factor BamE (lipoprotein component of BamABCDE complex)
MGEWVLTPKSSKTALIIALGAVTLTTAACSRIKLHQGYIADSSLVDAIQPGIDNRDSVEKTLGRPSFISQFGGQEWYYVARDTKQLAFARPTPTAQMVLRVRFDATGNVTAIDRAGMEKVARINPNGDKTPTLGRDSNFFRDLFGNIGTVGAGGEGAGTADNPN